MIKTRYYRIKCAHFSSKNRDFLEIDYLSCYSVFIQNNYNVRCSITRSLHESLYMKKINPTDTLKRSKYIINKRFRLPASVVTFQFDNKVSMRHLNKKSYNKEKLSVMSIKVEWHKKKYSPCLSNHFMRVVLGFFNTKVKY